MVRYASGLFSVCVLGMLLMVGASVHAQSNVSCNGAICSVTPKPGETTVIGDGGKQTTNQTDTCTPQVQQQQRDAGSTPCVPVCPTVVYTTAEGKVSCHNKVDNTCKKQLELCSNEAIQKVLNGGDAPQQQPIRGTQSTPDPLDAQARAARDARDAAQKKIEEAQAQLDQSNQKTVSCYLFLQCTDQAAVGDAQARLDQAQNAYQSAQANYQAELQRMAGGAGSTPDAAGQAGLPGAQSGTGAAPANFMGPSGGIGTTHVQSAGQLPPAATRLPDFAAGLRENYLAPSTFSGTQGSPSVQPSSIPNYGQLSPLYSQAVTNRSITGGLGESPQGYAGVGGLTGAPSGLSATLNNPSFNNTALGRTYSAAGVAGLPGAQSGLGPVLNNPPLVDPGPSGVPGAIGISQSVKDAFGTPSDSASNANRGIADPALQGLAGAQSGVIPQERTQSVLENTIDALEGGRLTNNQDAYTTYAREALQTLQAQAQADLQAERESSILPFTKQIQQWLGLTPASRRVADLAALERRLNTVSGPAFAADAARLGADGNFVTAGVTGEQLQSAWDSVKSGVGTAYDAVTTPFEKGNPAYDWLSGEGAQPGDTILTQAQYDARIDPNQGLPGTRTGIPTGSDISNLQSGRAGAQSGVDPQNQGLPGARTGIPTGSDITTLPSGRAGTQSGVNPQNQGLPGSSTGVPVGSRVGAETVSGALGTRLNESNIAGLPGGQSGTTNRTAPQEGLTGAQSGSAESRLAQRVADRPGFVEDAQVKSGAFKSAMDKNGIIVKEEPYTKEFNEKGAIQSVEAKRPVLTTKELEAVNGEVKDLTEQRRALLEKGLADGSLVRDKNGQLVATNKEMVDQYNKIQKGLEAAAANGDKAFKEYQARMTAIDPERQAARQALARLDTNTQGLTEAAQRIGKDPAASAFLNEALATRDGLVSEGRSTDAIDRIITQIDSGKYSPSLTNAIQDFNQAQTQDRNPFYAIDSNGELYSRPIARINALETYATQQRELAAATEKQLAANTPIIPAGIPVDLNVRNALQVNDNGNLVTFGEYQKNMQAIIASANGAAVRAEADAAVLRSGVLPPNALDTVLQDASNNPRLAFQQEAIMKAGDYLNKFEKLDVTTTLNAPALNEKVVTETQATINRLASGDFTAQELSVLRQSQGNLTFGERMKADVLGFLQRGAPASLSELATKPWTLVTGIPYMVAEHVLDIGETTASFETQMARVGMNASYIGASRLISGAMFATDVATLGYGPISKAISSRLETSAFAADLVPTIEGRMGAMNTLATRLGTAQEEIAARGTLGAAEENFFERTADVLNSASTNYGKALTEAEKLSSYGTVFSTSKQGLTAQVKSVQEAYAAGNAAAARAASILEDASVAAGPATRAEITDISGIAGISATPLRAATDLTYDAEAGGWVLASEAPSSESAVTAARSAQAGEKAASPFDAGIGAVRSPELPGMMRVGASDLIDNAPNVAGDAGIAVSQQPRATGAFPRVSQALDDLRGSSYTTAIPNIAKMADAIVRDTGSAVFQGARNVAAPFAVSIGLLTTPLPSVTVPFSGINIVDISPIGSSPAYGSPAEGSVSSIPREPVNSGVVPSNESALENSFNIRAKPPSPIAEFFGVPASEWYYDAAGNAIAPVEDAARVPSGYVSLRQGIGESPLFKGVTVTAGIINASHAIGVSPMDVVASFQSVADNIPSPTTGDILTVPAPFSVATEMPISNAASVPEWIKNLPQGPYKTLLNAMMFPVQSTRTIISSVINEIVTTPAQSEPLQSVSVQAGTDGHIDPVAFANRAVYKIANSSLNGVAPESLKEFGVTTGTPEEWARFFTMITKQESDLHIAVVNSNGTLERFPSTPSGEESYGPGQFNVGQYGLDTWADVNNPDRVIDAYIAVAEQDKLFDYFGSLKRPNETLQHADWYDSEVAPQVVVASKNPASPTLASSNPTSPFSVTSPRVLEAAGIPANLIPSDLGKPVTITYQESPPNRWDPSRGSFPQAVADALAAMGDSNAKYLGNGKLQVSSGPRRVQLEATQNFKTELEKRGLTAEYNKLQRNDEQNADVEGNPNSDHKIGLAADGVVTVAPCGASDAACVARARVLSGSQLERRKMILQASAAAHIQQLDIYDAGEGTPEGSIHIGMSPFRNGAPGEKLSSGVSSEGARRIGYGDAQVGQLGSLSPAAKKYPGMQEAFDAAMHALPPASDAALYTAIAKGDVQQVAAISKGGPKVASAEESQPTPATPAQPPATKSAVSSFIDDITGGIEDVLRGGGGMESVGNLSEAVTQPFQPAAGPDVSKVAVNPTQLDLPKNDHLQPTARPADAPLPVSIANEEVRPRTAAEAETRANRLVDAVMKKYPSISKQDLAAQVFFKGLGNTKIFRTMQADIATAQAQAKGRSTLKQQDIRDAGQIIGQRVGVLMMPEGFPNLTAATPIQKVISFSKSDITDPVDDYLWSLYQRMYYREDSGGVFTFKDPTASIRSGIPLRDIVLEKLPRDFKVHLASAAKEMDRQGLVPGFSAIERNPVFRPNAEGNTASNPENSQHAKGNAADFFSAKGLTAEQREDATTEVTDWLAKNADAYGLNRAVPGDEPHVQNIAKADTLTRTQEAELAKEFGAAPQVAENTPVLGPIDAVTTKVVTALIEKKLVSGGSVVARAADGSFNIKTPDSSVFVLKPEGSAITLKPKQAYTLAELKDIDPIGAAFLETALQKGGEEQMVRANNADTGVVRITAGKSGAEPLREFIKESPDYSVPKAKQPNVLVLRQNFRGELAASVINLLEEFNAKYGYIPRLSSGVRSNSVNGDLSNSAANSGHIFGLAADFSDNAELGGFKSNAQGNDFMKMARANGLATNDERSSASHIHVEAGPRARGEGTYSTMDKADIEPQTTFKNEKTQLVLYDAAGKPAGEFAVADLNLEISPRAFPGVYAFNYGSPSVGEAQFAFPSPFDISPGLPKSVPSATPSQTSPITQVSVGNQQGLPGTQSGTRGDALRGGAADNVTSDEIIANTFDEWRGRVSAFFSGKDFAQQQIIAKLPATPLSPSDEILVVESDVSPTAIQTTAPELAQWSPSTQSPFEVKVTEVSSTPLGEPTAAPAAPVEAKSVIPSQTLTAEKAGKIAKDLRKASTGLKTDSDKITSIMNRYFVQQEGDVSVASLAKALTDARIARETLDAALNNAKENGLLTTADQAAIDARLAPVQAAAADLKKRRASLLKLFGYSPSFITSAPAWGAELKQAQEAFKTVPAQLKAGKANIAALDTAIAGIADRIAQDAGTTRVKENIAKLPIGSVSEVSPETVPDISGQPVVTQLPGETILGENGTPDTTIIAQDAALPLSVWDRISGYAGQVGDVTGLTNFVTVGRETGTTIADAARDAWKKLTTSSGVTSPTIPTTPAERPTAPNVAIIPRAPIEEDVAPPDAIDDEPGSDGEPPPEDPTIADGASSLPPQFLDFVHDPQPGGWELPSPAKIEAPQTVGEPIIPSPADRITPAPVESPSLLSRAKDAIESLQARVNRLAERFGLKTEPAAVPAKAATEPLDAAGSAQAERKIAADEVAYLEKTTKEQSAVAAEREAELKAQLEEKADVLSAEEKAAGEQAVKDLEIQKTENAAAEEKLARAQEELKKGSDEEARKLANAAADEYAVGEAAGKKAVDAVETMSKSSGDAGMTAMLTKWQAGTKGIPSAGSGVVSETGAGSRLGRVVGTVSKAVGRLCWNHKIICGAIGLGGYYTLSSQQQNPSQSAPQQASSGNRAAVQSNPNGSSAPGTAQGTQTNPGNTQSFNDANKNTQKDSGGETGVVSTGSKTSPESKPDEASTKLTPPPDKTGATPPDTGIKTPADSKTPSRTRAPESGPGSTITNPGGGSAGASGGGGFLGGGMSLLSGLLQGLMAWFTGSQQDQQSGSNTPSQPQPSQPVQQVVGAITANPSLVNASSTTQLSWSSVGTDVSSSTCAVITSDFTVIKRGGQDGTLISPIITESTRFGLVCNAHNAKDKLLNETLVRVRGDDTDPTPIFDSTTVSANASGQSGTSASGSGTNGQTSGASQTGVSQQLGATPNDVRTCDPEQPIDPFIKCLCEAEPNSNGCAIPPGGLR